MWFFVCGLSLLEVGCNSECHPCLEKVAAAGSLT